MKTVHYGNRKKQVRIVHSCCFHLTHLDHPVQTTARLVENGLDALAARSGLVRDAALDKRAGLVGGDLACDEDVGAGGDGLAVWTSSWRWLLVTAMTTIVIGPFLTHVLRRWRWRFS